MANYSIDEQKVVTVENGVANVRCTIFAKTLGDIPAYDDFCCYREKANSGRFCCNRAWNRKSIYA